MSDWEFPTGPVPVQHPGGGGRVAWIVALLAVAVLLGVLALWAATAAGGRSSEAEGLNQAANRAYAQARRLNEGVDVGNDALSDPERTREVVQYLNSAIAESFSYDYRDLAKTEHAVDEYLTGKARCAYEILFGEVERYAPEQKIVLDTTVRELALVRLDGDSAEALVFIDQQSTRADVGKTVAVGGQFAVQAKRDGDHWKITEFDMFGQPLFNGKPAPTC